MTTDHDMNDTATGGYGYDGKATRSYGQTGHVGATPF